MKALKYTGIGIGVVFGGLVAAFFIDMRIEAQTSPDYAAGRLNYAEGVAEGASFRWDTHWKYYPPIKVTSNQRAASPR